MAFEELNISKKDQALYKRLAEKGQFNKLTSMFLNRYILPNSRKYQDMVKRLMARTGDRILPNADINDVSVKISSATIGFRAALKRMFATVINTAYAPGIFTRLGITSPQVKNTIKSNTLEIFKKHTEAALAQTNPTILRAIRERQKGLILINARIDRARNAGELLQKNVGAFKDSLLRNLDKVSPEFRKINNDQMVIYRDGSMHKLDQYAEMATRTTLLNVERTAVEVKETVRGRRVVEYYQRDPRAAKTPRKICPVILRQKFAGKSLLALDAEAASVLSIMTVEQAKATPDFAMGVFCRHSIRPISATLNNEIEKLLALANVGAA